MKTKPTCKRIGKSTSSGADTHTPDDAVSTDHAPNSSTPTTDSTRIATRGSGRCRTTRAIHVATSVPKSAIATNVTGEPPRAVSGEKDGVRGDHEERLAQTEYERLRGQQPDHAALMAHSDADAKAAL